MEQKKTATRTATKITEITRTDVLIIGGGPCGMFASFMCKMVGLTVYLSDALDKLGGQCIEIYPDKSIFDIPAFPKIKAKDLIDQLEKQMGRFDIKVSTNNFINQFKIDGNYFDIQSDGGNIRAKAIIFATGEGVFKPHRPKLHNVIELEEKGYIRYQLHNLDIFKDKIVVVGGGGDSALDWCLALKNVAKHTYLIHRRDKLRAMDSLQQELSESADKCDVILSADILSVVENNQKIILTYQDSQKTITTVEADYYVPCYGMQSDKSFLNGFNLDLDTNNRINVDPASCVSSVPGIYGIGDASVYLNKRNLIVCGFGEAANAAHHIRETLFADQPFNFQYSTSKFG